MPKTPLPILDLQIADVPGGGTYVRINSADQYGLNVVVITDKLRLIDTRGGKPVKADKVIKIPAEYMMDPEKSRGWQSFGEYRTPEIPKPKIVLVDIDIEGTELTEGGKSK